MIKKWFDKTIYIVLSCTTIDNFNKINIMSVGDSITVGFGGTREGYKGFLADIIGDGYIFVGNLS